MIDKPQIRIPMAVERRAGDDVDTFLTKREGNLEYALLRASQRSPPINSAVIFHDGAAGAREPALDQSPVDRRDDWHPRLVGPHGIVPQIIAQLLLPTNMPVAPQPPVQIVRAQITISVSRVTRGPSLHIFTAWWRAADCEAELAYAGSLPSHPTAYGDHGGFCGTLAELVTIFAGNHACISISKNLNVSILVA